MRAVEGKEEEEGNEMMMPDLKLRLTGKKSRSREEVMREEEKQMMADDGN